MSVVAWWIVPIVATLAAIAWTRWAARPRRPEGVIASVESYRRARDAMAPKPAPRREAVEDRRKRSAS